MSDEQQQEPASKRGGQPLNANPLTHGLRSAGGVVNVRLMLGSMPPKLKRVERAVNMFRRLIETATVEAHGGISVYHAALIQSAARHETHALMVQRWLRLEESKLDHAQRLAYSRAVADASTARDKCLERLRLDADASESIGDALDDIYKHPLVIEHQPEANQQDHTETQGEER